MYECGWREAAELARWYVPGVETKKGQYYIGRESVTDDPVILKANTLTTHGVIVGMTGSGKTGLGVNILEEALLSETPTLILDPKGDMGNVLLNFPDTNPDDLETWMDEGKAARKGVTVTELAAKESAKRQADLTADGLTANRIRRLRDTTDMRIYTPGSSAGIGLNILGSLQAPDLDWENNAEVITDEIEGLVSSILVLAGIDSDPVSGPEHILISTIVETWWRRGKDLDLAALVGQISKPPFRKLGVFDLDTFIPEKARVKLALQLNTLLASPSMASWLEGEPLDIENLIGQSAKTRCSIIYMAHLSEQERQFVVTLLLSKLVTWMRAKSGSSELRALVYLDEAFGYAPPTAEPPSKKPILTILKQARAFGVGLILVTQNPVDLDYKAMSNAGTWIVGRLQTENDKKRILEGIQSGLPDLDARISNLEKRQFVLHVTNKSKQTVFTRRHSMCFRYGPFTRAQVSSLMAALKSKSEPAELIEVEVVDDSSVTVAPPVAEGVEAVYLDPATPWASQLGVDPTGTSMVPAATVTIQLLYDDTKARVNHSEVYEAIIFPLDGLVDLSDVINVDHDDQDFVTDPPSTASYVMSNVKLQTKSFWRGLKGDLKNHLVSNQELQVLHIPGLKIYSRVGESAEEFHARGQTAADAAADAEMAKLRERFKTKIDRVKDQISTADLRVRELESEASSRKSDEFLSGAGDLLGAFLGGRKSSNPLGKAATRRAASRKAALKVDAATDQLDTKQGDLEDLEAELAEALSVISDEQSTMVDSVETIDISLEKTDIRIADVKLVWVPIG